MPALFIKPYRINDMKQLYSWGFALFSAHIHHFMPHIAWGEHPELYREWGSYHQPRPVYPDEHWDTSAVGHLAGSAPCIICLYHLGYHGQIPLLLKDMGLHFDLILDRQVYVRQRSMLEEMQRYMQAQGKDYRLLMSDDPRVLLQVRSALRAGKHILVFPDGNSGTREELSSKVKIGFLSGTLLVRQGIARISHLLQVPIVPMSHECFANGKLLKAGPSIFPSPARTADEYVHEAMTSLYQYLAQQVEVHPPLWESWGYLDRLRCLQISKEGPPRGAVAESLEARVQVELLGHLGYFDRATYRYYY